jgi:hypothetical protein
MTHDTAHAETQHNTHDSAAERHKTHTRRIFVQTHLSPQLFRTTHLCQGGTIRNTNTNTECDRYEIRLQMGEYGGDTVGNMLQLRRREPTSTPWCQHVCATPPPTSLVLVATLAHENWPRGWSRLRADRSCRPPHPTRPPASGPMRGGWAYETQRKNNPIIIPSHPKPERIHIRNSMQLRPPPNSNFVLRLIYK